MASHLIQLASEYATQNGTLRPVRTARAQYASQFPGVGSSLFGRGGPAVLDIDRAGTTAVYSVYGANASDPNGNPSQQNSGLPLAQMFKGDGSAVAFQTQIAYVAYANYNWIVTSTKYVTTGTVSTTAGSVTVTGSSTAFLTEYFPGELILINGEVQVVDQVASDTSLTTLTAWAASNSGVAVATVGAPIPAAGYTMSSVGSPALALCTLGVAPVAGAIIGVYYAPVVTIHSGTNRRVCRQIPTYEFMWSVMANTSSPSATTAVLRAIR